MPQPAIIAVHSEKGGVGRSMVARNLASALAASGRATLLLDLDPQGTCLTWAQWRRKTAPPPLTAPLVVTSPGAFYKGKSLAHAERLGIVNALVSAGLHFTVEDAPKPSDFPDAQRLERIVIDTPRDGPPCCYATSGAALTLVPVQPSLDDLVTLRQTFRTPNLIERGFVLFNRVTSAGTLAEAREVIASLSYRIAEPALFDRRAYAAAAGDGLSAVDGRRGATPKREVLALAAWVDDALARMPAPNLEPLERWLDLRDQVGWLIARGNEPPAKPVRLRRPKVARACA